MLSSLLGLVCNSRRTMATVSTTTIQKVSIEYASLGYNSPEGIYITPSKRDIMLWHGVLFVHQGGRSGTTHSSRRLTTLHRVLCRSRVGVDLLVFTRGTTKYLLVAYGSDFSSLLIIHRVPRLSPLTRIHSTPSYPRRMEGCLLQSAFGLGCECPIGK